MALAGNGQARGLSWVDIVRMGLVQTALGAIVVITTSTLNRVMIVELGLLAMLPAGLVAYHYAVQMTRTRWGYGSDMGRSRTPWIVGGMFVLGFGGWLAAVATAVMSVSFGWGLAIALVAFLLIGLGVGAAGTSLLALLATYVTPGRRAAAASTVWIMMILGFVVTTIIAGQFLDPFSYTRLVVVSGAVSVIAFTVATLAIMGVERRAMAHAADAPSLVDQSDRTEGAEKPPFREVLAEVWAEPKARAFSIFVFVSMLAYSMQDLILEPFAGHVFNLPPGESTQLSGVHHGGALAGMIGVALIGSLRGGSRVGALRLWAIGGCLASALAFAALAASNFVGPEAWPLEASVFALGLANGAFAVAAIGSMMGLAGAGRPGREGTRMGLWGAAQAIAFGLGIVLGSAVVDAARYLSGEPHIAYAIVFTLEGALFVLAAALAARMGSTEHDQTRVAQPLAGEALMEMEGGAR
ncbi:MAG: BCD family MFS transporter [Pseudomonadota bacterium]